MRICWRKSTRFIKKLRYFFQARVLEETGKFANKIDAGIDSKLIAISNEITPEELKSTLAKLNKLVEALEEKQYCEILAILENPE